MVLVKETLIINLLFGIRDFKMKHPTFLKICFCIFLKYMAFFLFLMFKNKNYYFINPDIRDGSDLFYYSWLLLSLPLLAIITFGVPVYYSFRIKSALLFLLVVLVLIIGEYFSYTYLASPLDLINGRYNALFTILFFGLFFFKEVKVMFTKHKLA